MIEWTLAAIYLGGVVYLTMLRPRNPAHDSALWSMLIALWPLWLIVAAAGELLKRSGRA